MILRWDTDQEPNLSPFAVPANTPTAGKAAGDKPPSAVPTNTPTAGKATGDKPRVSVDGYLFDPPDIAAGYEREDDRVIDRLRGGFVVTIWDPARRRLLVARDALGLHPCYYRWDGRVFEMSSDLDALPRAPVNRLVIAEHLLAAWSPRQTRETFYEGIFRLPPAHKLVVEPGKLEVSRHWDPLRPGFEWATAGELARFPELFERAVGRCLSAGADSIALSGGFDSVSIAILAAGRTPRPLHALSLRFTDTPCDEGPSQEAVARALGMTQTIRAIEESLDGRSCVDASLDMSRHCPCPVLGMWQALFAGLVRSIGDRGLRKILMGTGGDDLFSVDFGYGADRLAAFDLRGLWRFFRAWQRTAPFSAWHVAKVVLWDSAVKRQLRQTVKSLLGPRVTGRLRAARARRQTPAWIRRELADQLPGRLADDPPPPAPSDPRYVHAIRRLTQAPLLMLELDQGFAWGAHEGVTFLFPYFDRDLAELALRMHPEHLIAGGRSKDPLRRLVAERLPSVKLRSRKVDFTEMAHRELRPAGRAAWQALGGPEALAKLGVVDPDRVQLFMESYFAGRHNNWVRTWFLLSTETWLRARA